MLIEVASKGERIVLDVGGREVAISNPSKVYFPQAGITKLEVVRYYLAVAEGALRGAGGLKFPKKVDTAMRAYQGSREVIHGEEE